MPLPQMQLHIPLSQLVPEHPRRAFACTFALTLLYFILDFCAWETSTTLSLLHSSHNAWISIDHVISDAHDVSDIEIAQVYVRGPRLQALDKTTVLDALAIQRTLISQPESDEANINTVPRGHNQCPDIDPAHFILHSPLQLWNCSISIVSSDPDISSTLRKGWYATTPGIITLRPTTTLSNTIKPQGYQITPDALVITAIFRNDTKTRLLWDQGLAHLEAKNERYQVIPNDCGRSRNTFLQIYYARADVMDYILLSILYIAMGLYMRGILQRPIVTKRILLLVIVMVQTTLVTVICYETSGLLGIHTISVPPVSFPLIPLTQSLRNCSYLMSQIRDVRRYTHASRQLSDGLERLGFLPILTTAIASGALLLLANCARVSGLESFLRLTAMSLWIDIFVFHTFFVWSLASNLGVIRLEEFIVDDSETEQKISTPAQKPKESTKIPYARTFRAWITLGLVFSILYLVGRRFPIDFQESVQDLAWDFWSGNNTGRPDPVTRDSVNSLLSWFQVQEAQTLSEFTRAMQSDSSSLLVKLGASVTVARPSSPNMVDANASYEIWAPMSWPHRFVFLIVAIGIFWTVLGYNGHCRNQEKQSDIQAIGTSSATCLAINHSLDIYIIASCARKHAITVGFDRQIRFWDFEKPGPGGLAVVYSVHTSEQQIRWPLLSVVMDDKCQWVAFCSTDGTIALWSCALQQFKRNIIAAPNAQIVACYFVTAHTSMVSEAKRQTRLLMVYNDGQLLDTAVDSDHFVKARLSDTPIRHAYLDTMQSLGMPKLISVNSQGSILVSTNRAGLWVTRDIRTALSVGQHSPFFVDRSLFSVVPSLRGVGLLYEETNDKLHVVDLNLAVGQMSGTTIYTFHPKPLVHRSLRVVHSAAKQCLYCGSIAVASFSIVYTNKGGGMFTMMTLSVATPGENHVASSARKMCLRTERDTRERRCVGLAAGTISTYSLANPGAWTTTGANGVAGIRPKPKPITPDSAVATKSSTSYKIALRKQEKQQRLQNNSTSNPELTAWEAWTMTAGGVTALHLLEQPDLPPSDVGPCNQFVQNAAVIGLANAIVLVQFGPQLRCGDEYGDDLRSRSRQKRTSHR
ncbi:hypothetical protein BX600DRAFT_444080 [Xylariales sp. PMI_506]|nr:hypothetical protein BX600DRAFT_444080 [Xylariales sp. PMI_506]